MIGGNVIAHLQSYSSVKNSIGEREKIWQTIEQIKGFLDLSSGDSKNTTYNAKIQESTHIFICDWKSIDATSENARMLIDGLVYQVQLIDDPLNLHQHLEIYLKYVGGQNVGGI